MPRHVDFRQPCNILQFSDVPFCNSGDLAVTGLTRETGIDQVFNLDVEFDHVYYVGNLQALVHNVCNNLVAKAAHIFGKNTAKHNFTGLLSMFGGDEVAATAAIDAAGESAAAGLADGVYAASLGQGITAVVNGVNILVGGVVENGVFTLGTAFAI